MSERSHRFEVELYTDDWQRIGRRAVAVDLEPARECAWLHLLRKGGVGAVQEATPATVLPRWSARLGAPYIEGIRVVWDAGGAMGVDFANTYFRSAAGRAAAECVADGTLERAESCNYLVLAFPALPEEAPAARLNVRRRAVVPAVRRSSLERLRRGALLCGDPHADDPPVFIPEALLRDVEDRGRAAGATECGGVLIGRLRRDAAVAELFVEITAQIPARHTAATDVRLTFTPATWRDADAALGARMAGEIMLGWWHSHPVGAWCEDRAPERDAPYALGEGFLSEHDRHLHRTVFPRAYTIALVVTDSGAGHPVCALFGWRGGVLVRRGFYIRPAARTRVRSAVGERIDTIREVCDGSACSAG